ncbi:MAG TPA: TMEM43 family protein [Rhodanobacteraceae bacterium]
MAASMGGRRAWLAMAAGCVLVLAALWLTASNERAAAAWQRGLATHGDATVVADGGPAVTSGTVLVSGVPDVLELPRDPDFSVHADSPELLRDVQMFQWHEIRVGGKVSYEQDWVDHPVDSRHFDQPRGHANTQPFPFDGKRFQSTKVRLGPYVLAPAIVRALPGVLHRITPDLSHLPANLQASFRVDDGVLTTVTAGASPQLGDLRVRWLALPLRPVTVVAQADGDKLVPAAGGQPGFEMSVGKQSLTDVFADLPLPPTAVWAWRVLALVLAWLGLWLLLRGRWSTRGTAVVALACSVLLLAALAGIMWVTTSWLVAVIAWLVAVIAAIAANFGRGLR